MKLVSKIAYAAAVVGLCILGSILYGIAHDMVTAHLAVEYFTEYHPKIIEATDPVSMALLWGVIATWWMGAFFGAILAFFAVGGTRPLLPLRRVAKAIFVGLFAVLLIAMLVLGLTIVAVQMTHLDSPAQSSELMGVAVTHQVSYALSGLLGIVLCIWVTRTRKAIDPALPPA